MLLSISDDISVWENQLRSHIRQVNLICELPFDEADFELLAANIFSLVEEYGLSNTTDYLTRDCNAVLSLFLVVEGVYGYKGGDYWTDIFRRINISANYKARWGQTFEQFLRINEMPCFEEVEGHRFVKIILAHGGIPNYCLDDFFSNLLQPAVEKPELIGLTASELLQEWRYKHSAFALTDKPVKRFLLHGGRVAEDFLGRCLEMARFVADEGSVLPANELGLPDRVVQKYRAWLDRREEQPHGPVGRGPRLRRPLLALDPWGEGIHLRLPAQRLDTNISRNEVEWEVHSGEQSRRFRTALWLREGYLETEAEMVPLNRPEETYEVRLRVGGKESQAWSLPGIRRDQPILAFDSETGLAVNLFGSINRDDLLLVYPEGYELQGDGGQRISILESLPRLPGQWSRYTGVRIDLSEVGKLVIQRPPEEPLTLSLGESEPHRAQLIEGNRAESFIESPDGLPIYRGAPPKLRIPIDHPDDPQRDLDRWHLSIRPRGGAVPNEPRHAPVSELADFRVTEGFVDIPLELPELLGGNPIGEFHLLARGPLGRDTRLGFRMIPNLAVEYPREVFLPDDEGGPSSVSVLVGLPEGAHVVQIGGNGEPTLCSPIERNSRLTWYHAQVEGADITSKIEVHVNAGENLCRIPLHIRVPRFRWEVVGLEDQLSRVSWENRLSKIPYDALAQSSDPGLLVEFGIPDRVQNLSLRLLNEDGSVVQEHVGSLGERGRCRLGLASFQDNLNQLRQPVAEFQLCVESGARTVRFPILHVQQRWTVGDIRVLDSEEDAEERIFHICWREDRRLRDRVARFWNLWRPWDPPYTHRIADEEQGNTTIRVASGRLPPGKYRVELSIEDVWATQPAVIFPRASGGNTADVYLGSPGAKEAHLDGLSRNAVGCMERFLSRSETGVHDWGELQTLETVATPEDIPSLLEVLLSLTMGQYGESASNEFVRFIQSVLVFQHPGAFLLALSRRGTSLTPDEKHALVELLVSSGLFQKPYGQTSELTEQIDEENIEGLWRLWPPLGLILETNTLASQAGEALNRLERYLGKENLRGLQPWRKGLSVEVCDQTNEVIWSGTIVHVEEDSIGQDAALFGPVPPEDLVLHLQDNAHEDITIRWRIGEEVGNVWVVEGEGEGVFSFGQWARENLQQVFRGRGDALRFKLSIHPAVPSCIFGTYCGEMEIRLPREILLDQRERIAPLPQIVLDQDFHLGANYDWLISCREDRERENALVLLADTYIEGAKNDLDRLVEGGVLMLQIRDELLRRRFEGALNPLQNFPFLSGAVALVQRILARNPGDFLDINIHEKEWLDLAQSIYTYAPKLYLYDLCLSELLLAWYNGSDRRVFEAEDSDNG